MLSYVDICFNKNRLVSRCSLNQTIRSLRTADVSHRSSPLRDFSRETVLSGDERGETSAVRRLDNPTPYSFKIGSELEGWGGGGVQMSVVRLKFWPYVSCQLNDYK